MSDLKVLIVGCGNIAGGFDSAKPKSGGLPLTHAGAYTEDGRFTVAGCVEPNADRRQHFMQYWGVPLGFESIDEVLRSGQRFDVISICSPTYQHAHDLRVCIDLRPKVIFCEKPVTTTALQTKEIMDSCVKARIALAVNYTRRWDPRVHEHADAIQEGRWGALRAVVGFYNKGLLNSGSHMLDLLRLLLGPLDFVRAGEPVNDCLPDDPSVPVWLEAPGRCPVQLACGHASDFTFFELQLVFSKGIVVMENGGMFWRNRIPVQSHSFKGYRVLDEGTRKPGGYPEAMLRAVGNICDSIQNGRALASTGETALPSQQLCELIRQP